MDKRPWEVTPKKQPKHPSKKWGWKLRSVRNWCYNKWMKLRGYTPTTFNFTNNSYNYELRADADSEFNKETEPAHEIVGYKKKSVHRPWYRTSDRHDHLECEVGKQQALSALRKGDVDNECLIRRTV